MESSLRLESFLPLAGFPTLRFNKFQPLIEIMLNSVQYGSTRNDLTKKLNLYAYLCIIATKPAKFQENRMSRTGGVVIYKRFL